MNERENEIWHIMCSHPQHYERNNYINKNDAIYTDQIKQIATKIYQNDLTYLEQNQPLIKNMVDHHTMFFNFSIAYGNSETIRYLVDLLKKKKIINQYKYLLLASKKNNNLNAIRYFVEELKINYSMYLSIPGVENCLIEACISNPNLSVIKYFIDHCKISVNSVSKNLENPVMASLNNLNGEIFRYFVEESRCDINHLDRDGNNVLINAIRNNDLYLVKYLVAHGAIIPEPKTRRWDWHGLKLSYQKHEHENFDKIITFIVDRFSADQYVAQCPNWYEKIHKLTNYEIVNAIMSVSIKKDIKNNIEWSERGYDSEWTLSHYYKELNPLLINEPNFKLLTSRTKNIINPLIMKFDDYCRKVDELKCIVPFEELIKINNQGIDREQIIDQNVNVLDQNVDALDQNLDALDKYENENVNKNESEFLFSNNGIKYYGNRSIVYGSMHLFDGIEQNIDYTDLELNGQYLPEYIVKQWISSCKTGQIEMDHIQFKDMIPFLKFIDQYPTKTVTISLLEGEIMNFFNKSKIILWYNDLFIKNIIVRYRLKLMYLEMHNYQLMIDKIE